MEIKIENKYYENFIYNTILPALKFNKLTKENIDEIYDYIVENFEISYIETKNPNLDFINNLVGYLAEFMEFA